MSFVSFKFIAFITAAFFAYFAAPSKYRWIVLLIFSLLYYWMNSGLLLAVLLFESFFVYAIAKMIDKKEDKSQRKWLMMVGIIVVLLALITTKYGNFIITNINLLISGNISLLKLSLPIGISYYSLQAISYLVDVAKKKHPVEDNYFRFLLYMAYFPQIIQGPIPKYPKMKEQLFEGHEFDYRRVCHGLQLMLFGIAKKIIIADRLAVPINCLFNNHEEYHGLFVLFGVVLYGFQIYADFSGGIDAIRGISEVFGVVLDDNFRQPFFARSIEEFWRRWHISLGSWMKEYVFYPLTLSKRLTKFGKKVRRLFGDYIGKRVPAFVSMFVVYLLVGIWHGADWKYVVYGVWNGTFIMNGLILDPVFRKMRESLSIKDDSGIWKAFQIVRTIVIVSFGRILSRSNSLSDAISMISSVFTKTFDLSFFSLETLTNMGLDLPNWILSFVMIALILVVDYIKEEGIDIRDAIDKKPIYVRWMLYYLLIIAMLVFGKYGPGYDASNFIYGNF